MITVFNSNAIMCTVQQIWLSTIAHNTVKVDGHVWPAFSKIYICHNFWQCYAYINNRSIMSTNIESFFHYSTHHFLGPQAVGRPLLQHWYQIHGLLNQWDHHCTPYPILDPVIPLWHKSPVYLHHYYDLLLTELLLLHDQCIPLWENSNYSKTDVWHHNVMRFSSSYIYNVATDFSSTWTLLVSYVSIHVNHWRLCRSKLKSELADRMCIAYLRQFVALSC